MIEWTQKDREKYHHLILIGLEDQGLTPYNSKPDQIQQIIEDAAEQVEDEIGIVPLDEMIANQAAS